MKYKPHDYQKFAVDFIETHPEAAVLLECGLGKTSITLTALNDLMFDKFEVRKVLIIAPIRVCKNSWAAEIAKWDHLEGLNYSLVLGSREQRLAALRQKADLYIINRENVQWLIESSGMPFDFDMVVIDEDYVKSIANIYGRKSHQLFHSICAILPTMRFSNKNMVISAGSCTIGYDLHGRSTFCHAIIIALCDFFTFCFLMHVLL